LKNKKGKEVNDIVSIAAAAAANALALATGQNQ
jgi:hypothetical protein